jgi:hypothetical protein
MPVLVFTDLADAPELAASNRRPRSQSCPPRRPIAAAASSLRLLRLAVKAQALCLCTVRRKALPLLSHLLQDMGHDRVSFL